MAETFDVVVVGAGNAALCAALAARQRGARVAVLERAPLGDRGGNSAYTGGSIRVPYAGVEDVKKLIPDLSKDEIDNADWGSYSEAEFYDDIGRVTDYRANPDLAELLVTRSYETLRWLQGLGVRLVPTYGRYAHKVNGRMTFWGGPVVEVTGGGRGLVDALFAAAEDAGVEIFYETRAVSLVRERSIRGVLALDREGGEIRFDAGAVVLGAGGFQANAEWRARYLGPGWDLAKVRGTRFNTGDGIQMALDVGAMPYGHWSGCHAVGWDLNAPEFGDISVGDGFNKHQYPYGIMVNADGERFVDEGADLRNNTYAKYGRAVLEQPSQFAWQIFDAKVADLLRPDFYRMGRVTKVQADSLEDLVAKLEGVDPERCLATIHEFNAAVPADEPPFNPAAKDGRATSGLAVPKSNWALRLDTPPFEAFAVTCGITFTFGGVRIDPNAKVLDVGLHPIPGLYACGEMAAGVFYHNYPGSTGLSWGSVTGKAAGDAAAEAVLGVRHDSRAT